MKTLNITEHKTHLTNLLIDIYKESVTGAVLGFKGGTAAMLFYGLPRFSVDLDFDLIPHYEADSPQLKLFTEKMTKLLSAKYKIKDQSSKYHTLFWLISYGAGLTKIKIEISTRDNSHNRYNPTPLYGVTVKALAIGDMIAHKLIAVMDRKSLANRDLFDIHYFLSSPYVAEINFDIIKHQTGRESKEFYQNLLDFISRIKPGSVLAGLGELLTPAQKVWAKTKLIPELTGLIQRQIDFTGPIPSLSIQ